jgi:predicted nucleic acid-binding protein
MKVLLDTGVWFRRYFQLPQKATLLRFLDVEVTEFYLSPLSIAELTFKWQRGNLKGIPDPECWIQHATNNFIMVNPSSAASLQAGLWDWDYGDLVDRVLAAIAKEHDLILVHTDKVLKDFAGFPQKYFPNVAL